MKILIDCRNNAWRRLFDVPLAERMLRQLDILGQKEAHLVTPPGFDVWSTLRYDFKKRFRINVHTVQPNTVLTTITKAKDRLILLEGNGVYDDRVLSLLLQQEESISVSDEESKDTPRAVSFSSENVARFANTSLAELFDSQAQSIKTRVVSIQSMDSYIRFLRKTVTPTLIRVTETTSLSEIENDLYEKTFKGTLEFVGAYGYKLPVRLMTKLFAKTPITPNMITTAAIACSFGAIPAFFTGWLGLGLILAATFIILDSLDGKLARMTFRLSEAADKIDHATSMPARVAWYMGMAWHFSKGDWTSLNGIMGIVLTVIPVVDDINWGYVKRKFKKSLFDLTPLDAKVHLFTARRNDIFLMLLGWLFDVPLYTFCAITVWIVLTWLWRTSRVLRVIIHPDAV